jgi:flagellum-specific peptidoglycan hydrolase FlgJ
MISKFIFRLFLSLLFFLFININFSFSQSIYIKKYKPLSDSLATVFKIPSNVILGIAIVESSSGQGRNCKLLNNHFGIVGKNNLLKTRGIKTRYKQYTNSRESYIDFARMISRKKYYIKIKGNPNASDWIDEISKHGYSEKPIMWRMRVKETIKKNKL